MYRAMTLARLFDTKAVNLQRTGQLGTYASCLGHEATHVGVAAAMQAHDVLAPVYREYGTQLWRGVTMKEILTYGAAMSAATISPGPRHDFAWCVPIATQTLHAAGAAMAFKIRGEPRCALAYIGDGGTSEGALLRGAQRRGRARAARGVRHRRTTAGPSRCRFRRRPRRRRSRRRPSRPAFRAYRSTAMT